MSSSTTRTSLRVDMYPLSSGNKNACVGAAPDAHEGTTNQAYQDTTDCLGHKLVRVSGRVYMQGTNLGRKSASKSAGAVTSKGRRLAIPYIGTQLRARRSDLAAACHRHDEFASWLTRGKCGD